MTLRHIPAPLKEGCLCPACNGTGADIKATLKMRDWETGYIQCLVCIGRGLDAAEYFRWGLHDPIS